MGTAFRQRFFMMNFIYRNDDSFLKAQLTKRMCLNIAVTDSFPSSSVPATYSFISAILLVGTIRLLLMFLTVPSIRQIWTAGETTRTLWSFWHICTSFRHNKSLCGISPAKALSFLYIFLQYHFTAFALELTVALG